MPTPNKSIVSRYAEYRKCVTWWAAT